MPTPTACPTPTPTLPPSSGVIKGTLSYDEPHKLTSAARAAIVPVEVTAGADAGTAGAPAGADDATGVAQTSIKTPGPQPVAFQLASPFSVITQGDKYSVYAGIV